MYQRGYEYFSDRFTVFLREIQTHVNSNKCCFESLDKREQQDLLIKFLVGMDSCFTFSDQVNARTDFTRVNLAKYISKFLLTDRKIQDPPPYLAHMIIPAINGHFNQVIAEFKEDRLNYKDQVIKEMFKLKGDEQC